ncbi:MAG: imidazoleglycerol-phosphate dehydratase HisB [Anaerolineae bacterium]|nr:imidazoleglycerol-phosphate dehydratase HisB [Anaerolineae bacterium]
MRTGRVSRKTTETDITLALILDGSGRHSVASGVPFLDHMLAQLARHGLIDLELTCTGDVEVDYHHTVEDVGICLGQALRQALGEGEGIRRFGQALAPMDEALVLAALDVSGRGHVELDLCLQAAKIGDFDTELVAEFMRAFATNAGVTLHLRQLAGTNGHHIVESAFKSVALALRDAVATDPRRTGVPSTKGSLL